jgi:hypothetical protein
MLVNHSAGPATAATECKARKFVDTGKDDGRPSKPPNSPPQACSLHRGRSRASIACGWHQLGDVTAKMLARFGGRR